MLSKLVSLATGIPDSLTDKSVEWLLGQIKELYMLLSRCNKDIDKLRRTLKRIQCVLVDAEERRYIEAEAVKNWLAELRAATLDADDVLDRYDTLQKLKNKVNARDLGQRLYSEEEGEEGSSSAKRPRVISVLSLSFLNSVYNQLGQNLNFHQDIAEIESRLQEIAEGRKRYKMDSSDGARRGESRRATYTGAPAVEGVDKASVVGRVSEKKIIVSQLLLSEQLTGMQVNHPWVVPIWGVAGIGKTTLARMAVNDDEIKDFFDLCVWVSVPEGGDSVRITKEIIEAIRRRKVDPVSFNILQDQLRRMLQNKKFLLVLDNLWVQDNNLWENLQLALREGLPGSKVLITCRNKSVFRGMPVLCDPLNLGGLGETDGWQLLRQQAFPKRNWEDFPELEEIGKDIVRRCGGSPLAAKSLGSVLYEKTDEDYWQSLQREMWALKEKDDPVLSSLMISYHHLSYELKRCFLYCSVFPNGYEFDKEELVRFWMAEGLVLPSGARRMEIIGGKYFDDLCWKSFFEVPNRDEGKYKMPSLMHDLACLLSKSESLVFENNEPKVDSTCLKEPFRYASIIHREMKLLEFEKLYDYRNLRSVLVFGGDSPVSLWSFPTGLCDNLRRIRSLSLSNTLIEKVPDSIGDLIHLRYLGLSKTKIKELPETVCNLYNLQTIDLNECYDLRKLPEETSNLVNLRHIILNLDWSKITVMESMPPRIGCITSLETLSRFTVTKFGDNGSNIGELKTLKLRNELCLSNLEDVGSIREAKVIERQNVDKLLLQWSDYTIHLPESMRSYCEEVAKALCPQPRLRVLCFKGYPGAKFPDWLGNMEFKLLETLMLSGCKNCDVFPSLEKLPRLKNLHVGKMDNVVSMGNVLEFPSLVTLTIMDMPNLERWFTAKADLFPELCKLELVNCPKLKELKHLPPNLELTVIHCNSLANPPLSAQNGFVDRQNDMIID